MAIGNASTAELLAEIKRRDKAAAKIQKQRDRVAAQLAAIDAELAKLGIAGGKGTRGRTSKVGGAAAGPRKRPKNELTLADALAACAEVGAVVSPLEATAFVKKNGYKSSSATFGAQVANALAKHPKFKKQGRGQYKRVK